MSLFGDQPIRESEALPSSRGSQGRQWEYLMVPAHPRKKPYPSAVMNEYAAQGWRVVAVTPDVDFASRGIGVLITLERPAR